jgi:hypothetical protein
LITQKRSSSQAVCRGDFIKGVTKSWKSASVLVELIMIPVLAAAFVAWEIYLDDKAMLPMKLFKRPLVSYASSANIIDLISNLPIYSTAVVIAIFTQGPFYSLIQYLTVGYQALYK